MTDITITKLSKNNIEEALVVLRRAFGYNETDRRMYEEAFRGSLNFRNYRFSEEFGSPPTFLQYYVALEEPFKRVVGTTGLYMEKGFEKARLGLGWFCVDPEFRSRGIGTVLLDFTINQAAKRKRNIIELWTSTNPREKLAQKMYKVWGFRITGEQEGEKYKTLFMELNLRRRKYGKRSKAT